MAGKPTYEELEQRVKELEIKTIEFKQLEEHFVQSQMEFDAIFENAPLVMFLLDHDRRICKLNKAAVAMTQRADESSIGLHGGEALRCIHAYDDPRGCGFSPVCESCIVQNTVLDTFQTGRDHCALEAPIPYDAENGTVEIWVLFSTTLLKTPSGERVLVRMEDITERKQAEKTLQENEKKFRLFYKNAPLGYQSLDENGHVLEVNQAWLDLLGYTKEEVLGKSFSEFVNPVWVNHFKEYFSRLKEIGEAYGFELELVRKDGSSILTVFNGRSFYDEKGRFVQTLCIMQNITEKRRMEEDLVRVKDEWERTFNNVPDLISILDDKYRIVRVNKAMADKLGVSPEEAVGLTCYEHVHGTKEPPSFCPHSKLLSDGQEHIAEVHEERIGGDFLVSVSPLYDVNRKVTGCVHVARDITELKKTETALSDSEKRFRAIFEQAAESILLIDSTDGKILEFNDMAHESLGYTRDEFAKLKISDFEVMESADEVDKHIEKIMCDRTDVFETKHRTKTGEIRNVVVHSKAVSIGGGVFLQGMWIDITEQKQAEEKIRENEYRYRLLAENATDMISKHTLEGVFTYVSPSWRQILGYEPYDLLGHNVYEFFHSDDLESIRRSHRTILAGQDVYGISCRFRKKDGEYLWVETNAKTVRNEKTGEIEEIIANTRDISERKLVGMALEDSRNELSLRNHIADILLKTEGDQLYGDVLEALQKVFQSRFGYFGFIDEHGALVCPSMTKGIWKECNVSEKKIIFPKNTWEGLCGRSLKEKRTLISEQELKLPPGHITIKNAIASPILFEEKLIGQIGLADKPSGYNENDRVRLDIITAYIAPFLYQKLAKDKGKKERRKAEAALRASEEKLRILSSQLIQFQESERRRISIELHDELGQALMVLKLQLRSAQRKLDRKQADIITSIEESLQYIDEITDRIRRISWDLRPSVLDHLGLAEAVRKLSEEGAKHTNTPIQVEVEDVQGILFQDTKTVVFRVFQEALTNALKHADAKKITLKMKKQSGRLSCSVEDNGRGFDASRLLDKNFFHEGLGLTVMEERLRMVGGEFDIQSRQGTGTRIVFTVLLQKEDH